MKKIAFAAAALILSLGVNAQTKEVAGGSAAGATGSITIATLTAMGVSAAVAAAIIANNKSATLPVIDTNNPPVLICNPGDAAPVNGVCTGTTTTVTGTGTGTATTTMAVTFTYPASIQQ